MSVSFKFDAIYIGGFSDGTLYKYVQGEFNCTVDGESYYLPNIGEVAGLSTYVNLPSEYNNGYYWVSTYGGFVNSDGSPSSYGEYGFPAETEFSLQPNVNAFCEACGTDLVDGVCPNGCETYEPSYEQCPSCGEYTFDADTKICYSCGHDGNSVTCYFDPKDSYGYAVWGDTETNEVRQFTYQSGVFELPGLRIHKSFAEDGFYTSTGEYGGRGVFVGPVTGKQYKIEWISGDIVGIQPDAEDLVEGAVFKAHYSYTVSTIYYSNIDDSNFPLSQNLNVAQAGSGGYYSVFVDPVTTQVPVDSSGREFKGWGYSVDTQGYGDPYEGVCQPGDYLPAHIYYRDGTIVDNTLHAIWEAPVNVQVKTESGWQKGKEVWKKTDSGWVKGTGTVGVHTPQGWSNK